MAMLLAQASTGKIALACTFCGRRGTLKGLIVAARVRRSILSAESFTAKASSAMSRAGPTVVVSSSLAVMDWIFAIRMFGNSFIAASLAIALAARRGFSRVDTIARNLLQALGLAPGNAGLGSGRGGPLVYARRILRRNDPGPFMTKL